MAKFAAISIALFIATIAVSNAKVYSKEHLHPHAPCYKKCRFYFCDFRQSFKVGKKNDVSFTSAICAKDGTWIGHVDSTGEALLYYRHMFKHAFVPISKWHPYGLKQKFSPSFFKSYGVYKGYGKFSDLSGIGHETPQQNQVYFLHRKCFIVPLTAYQVLDWKGNVIDNVHPKGYSELRDCVAFKSFVY